MPRARQESGQEFIAIPAGEVADLGDEESDEEKAFQNFRNSINAGEEMATCRVSKIPKSGLTGHPMNAKSIYCFAFPVDRYTYEELCEFIRENYGGGLYRLLGTKKGHRGAAFNQLLELMEPVVRKPETPSQSGVGGNPSAIMETVANLFATQQERTEALFARLLGGAPQPAQVDPFAMMERVIGMLATMGFGKPAAAPQSDLLGELTKLAQLKGVLGPLLGVDSDGGGDRGGAESNFYDLAGTALKTIAPALSAVVAAKGGAPALPVPTGGIPEVAAGTAPPSPSPTQPPAGGGAQNVNLKRQVDILVMQAQNGADPGDVADMVLDMTPETKLVELHNFLSRPTVITEMSAVNPAVQTHMDFFTRLRAAILEQLADEPPAANNVTQPVNPT
jgi:hypothetical protein